MKRLFVIALFVVVAAAGCQQREKQQAPASHPGGAVMMKPPWEISQMEQLAKASPKFLVEIEEGAGDAVTNRAGASRDAPAVHGGDDVEPLDGLGGHERLANDHFKGFMTAEELIEALVVEGEGALAGATLPARLS